MQKKFKKTSVVFEISWFEVGASDIFSAKIWAKSAEFGRDTFCIGGLYVFGTLVDGVLGVGRGSYLFKKYKGVLEGSE